MFGVREESKVLRSVVEGVPVLVVDVLSGQKWSTQ
jgi:hypothetical protein